MSRRTVIIFALLIFLAGGVLGWVRFSPMTPLPEEENREIQGAVYPEMDGAPKTDERMRASPGGREEVPVKHDFRPAAGEPFSRSDLEASQTGPGEIILERSERAVFDPGTIHPAVGVVAEQAREIIEDLDRRTLESTKKVLEAIPFVEILPEKAELRPSGDGVKLTITVDPQNISFGGKARNGGTPLEEEVSGDEGPQEGQEQ